MPVVGSTLVRRQLGRRLKGLREAANKSARDVYKAGLGSTTKTWRMEKGEVPIKVADVRGLCWFYGADDGTADELSGLALATNEHGWWEDYGHAVPSVFRMFISLEAAASRIVSYQSELVPGLLQTEDYARANFEIGAFQNDEEQVRQFIEVRMKRQETLANRVPPPKMVRVLNASALLRQVGGPEVMDAQVKRLREADRLDHVEIRVVPFEAGAHAAMTGDFTIMEFPDNEELDVVHLETHLGGRYLEKPGELAECRRAFESVYAQSVPIEEHLR